VARWPGKAGASDPDEKILKATMISILEKLLADGAIHSYTIDRETIHSDDPGLMFVNRKIPEESVTPARTVPVFWSVSLIWIFAMTAFDGSVSVPATVLETVWPVRQRHDQINAQSATSILSFMTPQNPPDEETTWTTKAL
jgi:hypothetical protein